MFHSCCCIYMDCSGSWETGERCSRPGIGAGRMGWISSLGAGGGARCGAGIGAGVTVRCGLGCAAGGLADAAPGVGARTTCLQCGQRTCLPSNSIPTPMRRPQNGHGKVWVCDAIGFEWLGRAYRPVSSRSSGDAPGGVILTTPLQNTTQEEEIREQRSENRGE